MTTVLVTGATGTLGAPTTAMLRGAGHDVRALSRKSGPGLTTGDLLSGQGVAAAVDGVDALIHLATGKRDVAQAKTAIDAAKTAGTPHFVLISIAGIDNIPLGYYKGKVEIEKYLADSGVLFTIVRATQFHQFVDAVFRGQKFFPVIFAPQFSFQPIATEDVASRLLNLVEASPAGRVDDIGGPEARSARNLATAWKAASARRKAIWGLPLPGKVVAGFAAGHNLVPGTPYGVKTFEQYLSETYRRSPGDG